MGIKGKPGPHMVEYFFNMKGWFKQLDGTERL